MESPPKINLILIVTFNHLEPIPAHLPASRPSVASPSVPVLAQRTSSLNVLLSPCMHVCADEGPVPVCMCLHTCPLICMHRFKCTPPDPVFLWFVFAGAWLEVSGWDANNDTLPGSLPSCSSSREWLCGLASCSACQSIISARGQSKQQLTCGENRILMIWLTFLSFATNWSNFCQVFKGDPFKESIKWKLTRHCGNVLTRCWPSDWCLPFVKSYGPAQTSH